MILGRYPHSSPHSHGWKSVGYFNDIHYLKDSQWVSCTHPLGYII
jgi:nucleoside-specific outer membrane channel protein Tsx